MERTIVDSGLPARPEGPSDEQYHYALALAHYQTLYARFESLTTDLNPGVTEDLEKLMAVEAELKIADAAELLRLAEDQMIVWADGQFRRSLGKQRYQQIRPVFEQATKKGMKQRLVEICFKYRADGKVTI